MEQGMTLAARLMVSAIQCLMWGTKDSKKDGDKDCNKDGDKDSNKDGDKDSKKGGDNNVSILRTFFTAVFCIPETQQQPIFFTTARIRKIKFFQ